MRFIALILAIACASGVSAEMRTLPREAFLDKLKGAWAGQMYGVCFGAPWEFRSNGAMITKDLGEWKPEQIAGAIGQDDCYVEMTFLKAIEDFGLDVTFEEAGKAFGASQYPLWHANRYGRNNIRRGILPPLSGNPKYNAHADDIDFQIEADLFGIIAPGLPQESNKLCDIFGHVMNYGDGVYGGMFVAGMYAAAYFEEKDVDKVIRAGLACIPAASKYHQTITDVIAWHAQHPDDWQAAWKLIEAKYQDDVDCMPGNTFNINANLNGAYIVMGLLYGGGDMKKTVEVSVRCGQDADCNPSNAAGVLGCMQGYDRLAPEITSGIPAMADTPFDHTSYSFNTLITACERVVGQVVTAAGGSVDKKGLRIPVQAPKAPETLEQWTDKAATLAVVIPDPEIRQWNPAFALIACGRDMDPGLLEEFGGEKDVLCVHPVSETAPAILRGTLEAPAGPAILRVRAASDERGDYLLRVLLDKKEALAQTIDSKGRFVNVDVPLNGAAARKIEVELQNVANGWAFEAAFLAGAEVIPAP